VHILVIASSTFVLPASSFHLIDLLPTQDMFGGGQIHFGSCYAAFGFVMNTPSARYKAQNKHNTSAKCVWASSIHPSIFLWMGPKADKEKNTGNILLLLAIGSMCTYNVGRQGMHADRASNGCY